MAINTFYSQILTEHNAHPVHKRKIEGANMTLEGVNPSCGDDIILELRVEDGIIKDGGFTGSGCAISQASADIMLELVLGRTREEAEHLADIFMRMIKEGSISDEEMDELEEAGALQDIAHMPARVKCAVLGWRTMNEMFLNLDPDA